MGVMFDAYQEQGTNSAIVTILTVWTAEQSASQSVARGEPRRVLVRRSYYLAYFVTLPPGLLSHVTK